MTCIVALEQDGVIYVGADSAGVNVNTLDICSRADEKVFLTEAGDMIMGFCGSFRIGQLLRYALQVPPQKVGQDDMAYMVTDFIDAVRTMQKDKGSMKKENELEEHESAFIVGYAGKLYVIEQDFQVGRPHENYAAVGCGQPIAVGAMYATRNTTMSPEDRITLALQAAVEYSAGVRPPFHILKLEPEKE
jgi:ATP-dependent protease HslVU (ClpYQ) peptidase subunit